MSFNPNLYNEKYRIPTIRAEWWKYNGGIYHVTIKTQNAIHYFGRIICNSKTRQNEMIFSELGKYVDETISKISEHQWYAFVPVWAVMPNHIHMIVIIDGRGCIINQNNEMNNNNDPCRDVPWNVSTKNLVDASPVNAASSVNGASPNVPASQNNGVSQNNDASPDDRRTPELMSSISPKTGSLSLVIRQFKQSVTIYAKQHNIPFAWQPRFYESVITKQFEFERTWQYINNNVKKWKN